MNQIDEETIIEETAEEEKPPKKQIKKSYVKQLAGMGKTYKEIAERCGTTENYIKKMMYEDRKKQQEAEANKRPRGRPPGARNKRTIAEEKMLANWEHSPMSPAMREDKAELNRAAGWFVTQCWQLGKTVDHDNIESMQHALEQYVMLCTQAGMPMLFKTCHLALGLNPNTISAWRSGKYRSSDPRYKEFVEVMDAVIGAGIEAAGAAGSIDRVLTIWFSKAHMGMYEKQGLEEGQQDVLGEKRTAKEIAEIYGSLPD